MGALLEFNKEMQRKDYNIIIVMVDKLTKYTYFEPTITNAIVPETVKIFIEKIITQYI